MPYSSGDFSMTMTRRRTVPPALQTILGRAAHHTYPKAFLLHWILSPSSRTRARMTRSSPPSRSPSAQVCALPPPPRTDTPHHRGHIQALHTGTEHQHALWSHILWAGHKDEALTRSRAHARTCTIPRSSQQAAISMQSGALPCSAARAPRRGEPQYARPRPR